MKIATDINVGSNLICDHLLIFGGLVEMEDVIVSPLVRESLPELSVVFRTIGLSTGSYPMIVAEPGNGDMCPYLSDYVDSRSTSKRTVSPKYILDFIFLHQ